jgi:hypothetical protein
VKDVFLEKHNFSAFRSRLFSAKPVIPYLPPAGSIADEIEAVDKKEQDYNSTIVEMERRVNETIERGIAQSAAF